jgi:hypothetical protein
VRQLVVRNSTTTIFDRQYHPARLSFYPQHDFTAGRAVFASIVEQVVDQMGQ